MSSETRPWIEIYTTPTCPDCLALKRWLGARNLPYVEHDLRDPEIAAEAKRRTGVRVAPITIIDDDHVFYGTYVEQVRKIEALLGMSHTA